MGQQQLLLIVLGVIIVGIAVVVGINVFTASSALSKRALIFSFPTIGYELSRSMTAFGEANL